MQERKFFGCRGFRHITCNCRNRKTGEKKSSIHYPSNKFEILARRVMNIGEKSREEIKKDRKIILREKY